MPYIDIIKKRIMIPLEIEQKGLEGDGYEIKGLGSAFSNTDKGGDVIHPGAFKRSIEFYHQIKSQPAMLWAHDVKLPVGNWRSMEETKSGLFQVGDIWRGKNIPTADMAYEVAKGTGMKGLSIGFSAIKADRNTKQNRRDIYEIALKETSIVLWPMNEDAAIQSVKSLMIGEDGKFKSIRELEDLIRETLDLSSRECKALLSGGYKALASLRDEDETKAQDAGTLEVLSELSKLVKAMKV